MVYGLVSLVSRTCCIFYYLKSVEISPGFSVSCHHSLKFGFTFIFSLTLSPTFGKNCFDMAAFLQFSRSFCHFCVASSSSISLYNVLFGILLKETVVSLLHAAAFASRSASSCTCLCTYVCMYVCTMYICMYVCVCVCLSVIILERGEFG